MFDEDFVQYTSSSAAISAIPLLNKGFCTLQKLSRNAVNALNMRGIQMLICF